MTVIDEPRLTDLEKGYSRQIELERLSLPAYEVEESEMDNETFKQLFRTGGLAPSPVQPSEGVGQVATIKCSDCTGFTRCINCDRLTHWARPQGAQS